MNETNKKSPTKEKGNVAKQEQQPIDSPPVVKPPAVKQGPQIYCGPSYKGVQQYSIFNDGLPAEVESLKNENVDFAALIVPLDDLTATKQRIAISGTLENKSYISLGGN